MLGRTIEWVKNVDRIKEEIKLAILLSAFKINFKETNDKQHLRTTLDPASILPNGTRKPFVNPSKPVPLPVHDLQPKIVTRKLFTAGPVMVSDRVKKAMMQDIGTRHSDFAYVTQFVRQALLEVARVKEDSHAAIPIHGSGAIATEALLRTTIPPKKGKLLILENGIHGKEIGNICEKSSINTEIIPVDLSVLEHVMENDNDIIGVIVVHCETSSGIINPVDEIGKIVKKSKPDCLYFVDGRSTFGAVPINMKNVDFLVSTANKCLQSVPGLSFVIANKEKLQRHKGNSTGLALDLVAQYDELESTGQFRFTPPTHVMLALKEALLEYRDNGGLNGRSKRYKENAAILKNGMKKMGFKQLLDDETSTDGYIVTSYSYPADPLFVFDQFMNSLNENGHVLCAKEGSLPNSFCISCIGNIYPYDMEILMKNIQKVCVNMGINVPLKSAISW